MVVCNERAYEFRSLGRNVTKEAAQEEREEVLLPVIESIRNCLQVHWKVILGHASIIVQNMLRERPETFDPIGMVSRPETLAVIDRVMVALASPTEIGFI